MRDWLGLVALGGAYFAMAALALHYTRFNGGVALIWGATSLLLPYLMMRPRSEWLLPAVVCAFAGAAASILFGLGPIAALPFAVINVAEAAGGAFLLRRIQPRAFRFASLREIARFFVIAGLLMPLVCGFFAGITAHLVTGLSWSRNWFDYFAGHGLGVVTLAPLVVQLASGDFSIWNSTAQRRERAEALGLLAIMVSVNVLVFSQNGLPLLFVPLLPMLIAVFRLGRIGAAMGITVLTLIAVIFTIEGTGPISLVHGGRGLQAQILQFYLAWAVLMALPVAAELKHRKMMFGQLQTASAIARLVLDRTSDVIMFLEIDGTIGYVSPSVEAMAGYHPEELMGRTPHAFIHADDLAAVVATHREALQAPDDKFVVEYRGLRADDTYAWYEVHTRATVDEDGDATGVVSIIHEISARKSAEDQLVREAQTDPLTGVLNRRAFEIALDQRFAAGQPFTVVLFDLDHFKSINDTYGHETGDIVIKEFARHLHGTLRRGDVIARFGGEEFVAVLDGADAAAAREVCERMRHGFAQHRRTAVDGRTFTATVSGGIASYREGIEAKQLLAEADAALYRAKSEGRNRLAHAA